MLHLLGHGVEIPCDSRAEGGSYLGGFPPSALYFLDVLIAFRVVQSSWQIDIRFQTWHYSPLPCAVILSPCLPRYVRAGRQQTKRLQEVDTEHREAGR